MKKILALVLALSMTFGLVAPSLTVTRYINRCRPYKYWPTAILAVS